MAFPRPSTRTAYLVLSPHVRCCWLATDAPRPRPPSTLASTPARVSRIVATSENYETELLLDVNTMLYPMAEGCRFTMALASTLDETGEADTGVRAKLCSGAHVPFSCRHTDPPAAAATFHCINFL